MLNPKAQKGEIEPSKPTVSDWVLFATLNEELISKEIRLSSDRIGWLITTQSFLFGAFCLIAISSNNNTETARNLLLIIPVLGLLTLLGTMAGVIAARIVLVELEKQRGDFQKKLNVLFGTTFALIDTDRQGRLRGSRMLGGIPFNVITVVLLLLWGIILYHRVQLKILPGYR